MSQATMEVQASRRPAVAAEDVRRLGRHLLFVVCASLYLIPIIGVFFFNAADQGTLVLGAMRVANGEVFGRDFFEVIGPGSFYWLAFFFKVFGVTYAAVEKCLFLTSLGTVLAVYFLSARTCGRYRVLPCCLLTGLYFGAAWPGISHHTDSNCLALLAIVCVVLWEEKRASWLLLAAGVLAGLTTSVHWPKGVLLLASILLWLGIERYRRSISIKPIKPALLLLAGFCISTLAILAFFRSQGALRDLLYANFLWPSKHYGGVNACPYAQGLISNYWDVWTAGKESFRWLYGLAALLMIPFLVVVCMPLMLLMAAARNYWKTLRADLLLYWLSGWAIWLSEFHRRDIYHLVLGSPVLLIVLVALLAKKETRWSRGCLQVLTVSAVTLCGFNLVLVGVATHKVATRVGNVAMFGEDQAVKFLDEHTSKGDAIFAYPYCPIYYFLSGTRNPTRYSILVYNYNTRGEFLDALHGLETQRPKYVIWNTRYYKDAARVFPAATRISKSDLVIEPYLTSHYTVVEEEDGIRVMERNSDLH